MSVTCSSKGKRVPIIGNIRMDTRMIDVTDTNAAIGDEGGEIFGKHILVLRTIGATGNHPVRNSQWHLSPRKTGILQGNEEIKPFPPFFLRTGKRFFHCVWLHLRSYLLFITITQIPVQHASNSEPLTP